jgi:branched-chain amino acid transport system ATP-binding protein
MTTLLETRQVSKFFGGLTAVNKVDLVVPERAIASIIGPNGAGKTTLFNCISGFYKPEKGDILYKGKPVNGLPTNLIAERGISRTYQNIRLFSNMTAIENIIVGQTTHLKATWMDAVFNSRRFREEETQAIEEGRRLLKYVGLTGLGA